MSRLLLYTDLSPSWPWLFATVHANTTMLAEHGITCAAFRYYTEERLPAHNFFWNNFAKHGANATANTRKRLNEISAQLDAGKDVLLMNYAATLEGHRALSRFLQDDPRFAKHDMQILFRLGNSLCFLEQRIRAQLVARTATEALTLVCCLASLSKLVEAVWQQWGRERATLLPDLSASPVPIWNDALAEQLFAWLGCPPPVMPEHTPMHHVFLASWEGRRLALTPEVGYNAWPPLNTGLFMDCLAQVEQGWGTGPVCPRKYRQIVLHEGADDARALEELLQVPCGSLACPEWLATEKELPPGLPLPQDRVRAFVQALPEAERAVLRQRFYNDALVLTPDQQALATALAETGSSVARVGEPVPPATLTVLTMTYNHERYIAACMDSVLAQQTQFPVRHIVLDHHSQDDTPHIIAAYAARHPSIQPVLLSRRVPSLNVSGLFARCRSTYVSICDGDDYFTDPLKLQKQVDYLEQNRDCALCAHPVQVVFEDAKHENYIYPPESELPRGFDAKYPIEQLLQGNFIQTNAVVYRWRFTEGLPEWFRPDITPGDLYWHLLHAELGLIGFMPEIMSVYRRHRNAVYHTAHVSVVEHRRVHGMAELRTYKALDEHFQGKYFDYLAALANGVLTNFLQISINEDDDSLMNAAIKSFPEFGRFFLNSVKIVCQPQ